MKKTIDKSKIYVLTVSKTFPTTHASKGQDTHFVAKMAINEKIHTIRSNYPFWAKRIEEVNKGISCLSVRTWTDQPYKSKQNEEFLFQALDGIGIEKVFFDYDFNFWLYSPIEKHQEIPLNVLCENDGLCESDFREWFRKYKPYEEMAIIHFTDFRYLK